MRFLGIDLGGTFIKAAVLDLDTMQVRDTARVESPPFLPASLKGQREVDVGEILSRSRELLTHVARFAGACSGLMVSGQMGGLVLSDGTGRPLSNYVSWQDMRAEGAPDSPASANALRLKLSDDLLYRTGNDFRASNTIKILHWMGIHKELPADAVPGSIMSYLIAQLSGGVSALHPTDAAAFGCLQLATSTWDTEFIKSAGLHCLSWPEIKSRLEPIGEVSLNGCTFPVYPAVGDQQAALTGACLAEHELSINIATGSQVAQLSRGIGRGDFQVRPYFDNYYLATITHIPSGRSLRALLEFTGSGEISWDTLQAEVDSTPETDLEVDLSFYPGPCGDFGQIRNLHESNMNRGHLLRAAFKNMAQNYFSCASRLPDSAPQIVFSGGLASRFAALRHEILELFGKPSRIASDREDALLGLLVLARSIAEGVSVTQVKRKVAC